MNIIIRVLRKIKRIIAFDNVDDIARKVSQKKLTYLSHKALLLLGNSVKKIEKNNIEGSIIETGCALGGSSILIGKLKSKDRQFNVYDSFEMMPEPTENDGEDVHNRFNVIKKGVSKGISGNKYYGYEKDLYNKVKNSFKSFGIDLTNIQLIKGYYEDTLKINDEVAMAHIDCDWYDSVLVSLQRIEPYLVVGGVLIIDDYYCYSGCKKAVDDYFNDKIANYNFIQEERLVIEKIK
ncbi:TylF/MycF/NovP-related O-methyltransferase [Candidatus Marifrigoribacter sp. Uisw_064]|jgi:asparagine synthase (glutamine-hydrolysing)|uniref:TylF/MycF/NovP-related O-methyltransferase n=1 Tax=Candidatus Marifrigoribacter sp. Uisw_064 TaxID=3230970 RepID=UPI003ADCC1E4